MPHLPPTRTIMQHTGNTNRPPCFYATVFFLKKKGTDTTTPPASAEALSWTEYRRALSELCPAFGRFGISTCTDDAPTPGRTSADTYRHETSSPQRRRADIPSENKRSTFGDGSYCNPWDTFGGSAGGVASRSLTGQFGIGSRHSGRGRRGSPPRSPGADSFHALRRKRHAAVSLDYEAITRELPQVQRLALSVKVSMKMHS